MIEILAYGLAGTVGVGLFGLLSLARLAKGADSRPGEAHIDVIDFSQWYSTVSDKPEGEAA